MIETIFTTMLATGCFLIVISLPVLSWGKPLRRLGLTLIAIPLAYAVFFGLLAETVHPSGVKVITPGLILTVVIVSVIAYGILAVRRRIGAQKPFRIREKRPIDRRSDFISFIREELKDRDE